MIRCRPLSTAAGVLLRGAQGLLLTALVLVAVQCSLLTVAAQSTTATLSGTVEDQQGAVIPGVVVAILNVDTSLRREATTNEGGAFTFTLLPPGHYTITGERQGFAPVRVENLVLNVGDQKALQIQLKAGDVNATVQVTSEAPLINESPAVGTVVDRRFVENMPLNGRSFQTLIDLTPGVVVTPASFSEQGQFSVNGQRPDANYFTVDGVSANFGVSAGIGLTQTGAGSLPALTITGGTNGLVSVDAMQEFRVQTSTFAPEYGRTPGGQISILTRSGTNSFHGTVFDYLRNDVFDANDWFANANGLPKPKERQNDFGGVLGGPVLKNKTFFFFSYEGLRLRLPTTIVATVPNLATRQNAPAAIRPFVNVYPLPNGADFLNGTAQFTASFSNPATINSTSVRIDHTFGTRLTLFGRYSDAPSRIAQRAAVNATPSAVGFTESRVQIATLGSVQNFTARLSNDLRINFSKATGSNFFTLDNFGGATPVTLPAILPSGAQPSSSFFFFQTDDTGFWLVGKNATNEQRQLNVVDNLFLVAGKHQLKFGVDYRRLSALSGIRSYDQSVDFSAITGVLGGIPDSVSVDAFQTVVLINRNFSAYAQDTWKLNPRLSVTYGLRWDVNPPLHADGSQQPFALQNVSSPATISLAPTGTPLYQTAYGSFAPRIGATYQLRTEPGWEAVLRGGFGVFYDLGIGNTAGAANSTPFASSKTLTNVAFPLSQVQAAAPPFTLTPPLLGDVTAADPDLKVPRTYQWNVALEQSLGANQSLSLTYVGAIGRKLLRSNRYRNPNPTFAGTVTFTNNTGTSDYHALQARFNRRLTHGLQALASYTWSHSIDNASTDTGVNTTTTNPQLDRGSSNFDVRHSFSGALSYDIPAPRFNRVADAILRDWSIDTLFLARSAPPVDLIGGTITIGFQASVRPDLIPGVPLYLYSPTFAGGKRFNKAAFAIPKPIRQGTLGRNVLRGFGAWQQDLAVRRQFHLTEKVGLQLRAELFNVYNHPNFGRPISSVASGLFGRPTQMLGQNLASGVNSGVNPLYQIGGPRSMQFALKVQF